MTNEALPSRARTSAARFPAPHPVAPQRDSTSPRSDGEKRRGGYAYPASQTPWQEIQRGMVDQLSEGMVLKPAVKFQKVAQTFGVPRDNH